MNTNNNTNNITPTPPPPPLSAYQFDRNVIIHNAIYHYSTIMYEYQLTMNRNLHNNFIISEYTKRIRDYQNDMQSFISSITDPNVSAAATTTPAATDSVASTEEETTHPPNSRARYNQSYVLYTLQTNTTRNRRTNNVNAPAPSPPPMENVIVAPTVDQINNAVERINFEDIGTNIRCPISLEEFTQFDIITRIRHCGHIFKRFSLTSWFRHNVRCPVCRYDIRDYVSPEPVVDVSNSVISDMAINIIDSILFPPQSNIDRVFNFTDYFIENAEEPVTEDGLASETDDI